MLYLRRPYALILASAICILVATITLHQIALLALEEAVAARTRALPHSQINDNDPYSFALNNQILPSDWTRPSANGEGQQNATFVMLCRNSELEDVLSSMADVERRFNGRFGYPWIFLNEGSFTTEFVERVREATKAPVSFGRIPASHWYQPAWIDEKKATYLRWIMKLTHIKYGGSVSYRNMCRFNSGFFFRHPMLQHYKYYWRVEPNIQYSCDITYDPFQFMASNNKTYGFTISLYEGPETIKTLWKSTREFIRQHPQYLASNNALDFISDNSGKTYNLCHFWSNFEIADMDFWRGEAYQAYFDFLERKGGFYYERWGDAPVHSIGAVLFANKTDLHFFEDIGYRHDAYQHCPASRIGEGNGCGCKVEQSFDHHPSSCLPRWEKVGGEL